MLRIYGSMRNRDLVPGAKCRFDPIRGGITLFHFCKLGQASTRLPPTSAQVLGERREQTL